MTLFCILEMEMLKLSEIFCIASCNDHQQTSLRATLRKYWDVLHWSSLAHFFSGAPWCVTWCLLKYHLFFTFFWQISHCSSLPTVCMFRMCWNTKSGLLLLCEAIKSGEIVSWSHSPASSIKIQSVLSHLFEIELVAEHPLTVLTHARLPGLPGGAEQRRHLVGPQQRRHLVSGARAVHTLQVVGRC